MLIKITFPFVTYGFSYLSPPTRPTGQTATLLVNLICKKFNCGIIWSCYEKDTFVLTIGIILQRWYFLFTQELFTNLQYKNGLVVTLCCSNQIILEQASKLIYPYNLYQIIFNFLQHTCINRNFVNIEVIFLSFFIKKILIQNTFDNEPE